MAQVTKAGSGGWLNRRFAFKLHGWCGFLLSLLLFTICFSGTLAVVSHEIDWLLNPDKRAAFEEKPIAWQTIYENVRELHPEARILWLAAPELPGFAVEAVLNRPDLKYPWRVYANPYSGGIQGEAGWLNAQRLLRSFHMYFFIPRWGKYMVTFFGFVLLGSLITGLIVYRKWWRGFFTFERKRGRRILWGSAHKLMGVWSLWFITAIAVTSVWYFAEQLIFDLTEFRYISPPKIEPEALAAHGPAPPLAGLDAMAARARQEVPKLEIRQIFLPGAAGGSLSIQGQASAWLVRDRTNKINFHPYTGELVSVQLAGDLSPAWRWVDTADPLHFGNFGGLATKLIWFFFGLVLNAMILSGAWLYLRRMNRFADRESGLPEELKTGEPAREREAAPAAREALRHG